MAEFDDAAVQRVTELFETCRALHRKAYPRSSLDFDRLDLTKQVAHGTWVHAKGNFADVYRGTMKDGPMVAVKTLRLPTYSSYDDDLYQTALLRFFREMNLWGALEHTNIVPFLGYTLKGGNISFVSSWHENGNLVEFLRKNLGASEPDLILDVAEGAQYLHTCPNPLIHGDLKAANILVSEQGIARLADFGISKQIDDMNRKTGFTTASGVTGTMPWMAPELDGDSQLTSACDVYSCACVFLEICCPGKIPYYYLKPKEIMRAKDAGTPPDLLKYPEFTGRIALWGIMSHCWTHNPLDRPDITSVVQSLYMLFKLNPRVDQTVSRRPAKYSRAGGDVTPGICILADLIYAHLQEVRVRGKACKALGEYCMKINQALIVSNYSKADLSPSVRVIINRLVAIFTEIEEQSRGWKAFNIWQDFLYHSEVKEFIDQSLHHLSGCLNQLGLVDQVADWSRKFQKAGEDDHREIEAAENKQNAVANQTKRLQERLTQAAQIGPHGTIRSGGSSDVGWIKDRLFEMRIQLPNEKDNNVLPYREISPSELHKIGVRPMHKGDTYDFWQGKWLGRYEVVIKIFRGVLPSENINEAFLAAGDRQKQSDNIRRWNRQIDIWRSLSHENILKLYGVCTFPSGPSGGKKDVTLVTPYMKNRDAARYFSIKNKVEPTANRMTFITGIARGLEYLHSWNIVHGGLQGSKVLVSDDGSAVLSDFIVSKFMVDNATFTGNQGATNAVRWLAPEATNEQVLTAQADVYSWAMTALQVLSGRDPFYKIRSIWSLVLVFKGGQSRAMPSRDDYTLNEIDAHMWDLLSACWAFNPQDRPTIDGILKALEAIIRAREQQ